MLSLIISNIGDEDDRDFMTNTYNKYYRLVRKTIFDVTHDNNEIDDLIADTFMKILENLVLIRTLDCRKMTTYIVYTSRNTAINHIRHRDVERKHQFYGRDEDMAETIIFEDDSEERLVHQAEVELLSNSIMKLSQKEQDLLHYKYILDMNNAEISEVFGVTESAIRQYLTRARRKAKKLIEKTNY